MLIALAAGSIGVAAAIGIYGAVTVDPLARRSSSLPGSSSSARTTSSSAAGRFHSDAWFALAWGAFPVLTAYFAQAGRIRLDAVLAAVFAFALSLAQRRLSTPVREVRRQVVAVDGRIDRRDGTVDDITRETITAAPEGALRLLTVAAIAVAAGLLIMRVA